MPSWKIPLTQMTQCRACGADFLGQCIRLHSAHLAAEHLNFCADMLRCSSSASQECAGLSDVSKRWRILNPGMRKLWPAVLPSAALTAGLTHIELEGKSQRAPQMLLCLPFCLFGTQQE